MGRSQLARKQPEGNASTPGRKAVTKQFRRDLVERLKALAAQIRPRTSVTAVMEAAFEDYLMKHEKHAGA